VGRALFGDDQFWTRRRRPFTPEQIGVLAAGVDLFHGLDLAEADTRAAFLTLCASPRESIPRANLRAKDFTDARIDEIVDTLLQRCHVLEIVTTLQIAEDRARAGNAAGAAVVGALIENYPWYANAYGRAASYAGSEQDGVAAAVEAIVLDPVNASRWQVLAATFRTAGNTQDAERADRVAARLTAAATGS
jgi:Flp pilus assembly protein TadD